MEFLAVSWSNVFSFRLERQLLSDSKRKDPNITALKSKSGICTSLSSPHHPRVRCRVLIQAKIPISYFRFTQITILYTVKTQTILVITARPCCPRVTWKKQLSAVIHRFLKRYGSEPENSVLSTYLSRSDKDSV